MLELFEPSVGVVRMLETLLEISELHQLARLQAEGSPSGQTGTGVRSLPKGADAGEARGLHVPPGVLDRVRQGQSRSLLRELWQQVDL